jgi:hypothetical protein
MKSDNLVSTIVIDYIIDIKKLTDSHVFKSNR